MRRFNRSLALGIFINLIAVFAVVFLIDIKFPDQAPIFTMIASVIKLPGIAVWSVARSLFPHAAPGGRTDELFPYAIDIIFAVFGAGTWATIAGFIFRRRQAA